MSGTGSAAISGIANGTVTITETGTAQVPCGGSVSINETLVFNSSDSLTLSGNFPATCTGGASAVTISFNVSGGTGIYSGRSGSVSIALTTQSSQVNGIGPFTRTGSGSGTLSPQLPTIASGGIVPVYSSVPTIQSGEWVSIYGTGFSASTTTWNGDFPVSLGGTSVTIDGIASLALVRPAHRRSTCRCPPIQSLVPIPVVVKTPTGTFSSTVTLASVAPSFSLLDAQHVTGNYSSPRWLRKLMAAEPTIFSDPPELHSATPQWPRNPVTPLCFSASASDRQIRSYYPGRRFPGSAPTVSPVNIQIGGVQRDALVRGSDERRSLSRFNLTVPTGLGVGDIPLLATVGNTQTQAGIVIALKNGPVVNQTLTITTSGAGLAAP